MKVTLEKVFANVKENKFGPKLSVGLKVREPMVLDINGNEHSTEGRYINAWFDKDFIFPHKEGDVVDLLIVERNGYLDFKLPGVGKPPTPDMGSFIERLATVEGQVSAILKHLELNTTAPAKAEEDVQVDPEDF